jgi:hypothetical protein
MFQDPRSDVLHLFTLVGVRLFYSPRINRRTPTYEQTHRSQVFNHNRIKTLREPLLRGYLGRPHASLERYAIAHRVTLRATRKNSRTGVRVVTANAPARA